MSESEPGRRPPTAAEITSTIGREDRVRGALHVGGCARIDGVVRGDVEPVSDTARVVIGANGHVRGDIRVHSVWIEGQVVGRIWATGHVELGPGARIEADVTYMTLRIAAGARLDGQLRCLRGDEA